MKRIAGRAWRSERRRRGSPLAALLLIAACSSAPEPPAPPPPTRLQAMIEASTHVNPDMRNRPSPIVTRLYELTSANRFSTADFFDLYENDGATLATAFVRREEFAVVPLGKLMIERQLQPSTRFIGVIAAYRDIDKAAWRAIAPIELNSTNRLAVRLEPTGIVIRPAAKQDERSTVVLGEPTVLTPHQATSPSR